jgi:hypothetical protein
MFSSCDKVFGLSGVFRRIRGRAAASDPGIEGGSLATRRAPQRLKAGVA